MEDRVGTTLGGFRLLRLVGRGAKALVYEAESELVHGQRRTIKVLNEPLLSPAALLEKLGKLDHPNLQRWYGLRKDGDSLFPQFGVVGRGDVDGPLRKARG